MTPTTHSPEGGPENQRALTATTPRSRRFPAQNAPGHSPEGGVNNRSPETDPRNAAPHREKDRAGTGLGSAW